MIDFRLQIILKDQRMEFQSFWEMSCWEIKAEVCYTTIVNHAVL